MKKISLLVGLLLFTVFSFSLEIDGKAKSSFGFFVNGDHDNSWATEKAANVYPNDASSFKTIVGLTLKNDDTKVYWETKFQASSTAVAMSAAYLYIDTELKAIPGALRVGFQRMGILDAETHPYADGSFYTFCKDKGTGIAYYLPIMDYDVKFTYLGNVSFLDVNNLNNSTSKTFLGMMVKSGSDYSFGAIYSTDSNYSGANISGLSLYGDLTMNFDALKLVETVFLDLSDDASKAYLTSKNKAKSYLGSYLTYDLNGDLMLYANLLLDFNKVNISNKISGGMKYKISNKVALYTHYELVTDTSDNASSSTSIAFETSI
ncbi:MAG: hypothetical protein PHV30_00950 [Candidatus Margulisbacteria bacterium]|nr:hypothetical protein [Candidatus Margulisiibacteriota bacterium]